MNKHNIMAVKLAVVVFGSGLAYYGGSQIIGWVGSIIVLPLVVGVFYKVI